jgi:mannose-6-phosphate isomerase
VRDTTREQEAMAQSVYRLDNTVQHYDWGSPTRIHGLLGSPPDGRPAAELWLGAHPSAPSLACHDDGTRSALDALLREDPAGMLGRRVSEEFGPRLPYLLKVLAAERALSLQVHPKPHVARAGFNRENRLGVPLDAPHRSFHDDQHKPEMLVALSQFEALAGFRNPRNITSLLDGLEGPLVEAMRQELAADRSARGMRAAFQRVIASRGDEACADAVARTVASVRGRAEAGSPFARADATVLRLAEEHPGDPAAIASLMLNRITLEPGEALFLPAGEIHAYLAGLGIEIMASSDNVLRAGLTTKHVDQAALLEAMAFEPRPPVVPRLEASGSQGQAITFRPPVREYALTLADVDAAEPVELADNGPRIVLGLTGDLVLHHAGGVTPLPRGASVFVPDAAGRLSLHGTGHAVCAWVP